MKMITKYQAQDGAEFKTVDACVEYERLLVDIDTIMQPLGERNSNTNGWVQHNAGKVLDARRSIMRLAKQKFENLKQYSDDAAPMSIVGRILDDCGGPLNRAWGRFMSIDDKGREHNQPYYAINGPSSDQTCLENR